MLQVQRSGYELEWSYIKWSCHDRGISLKVPILIEINISHNFQYIFKLSIPDIYKYVLALIQTQDFIWQVGIRLSYNII